MNNLELATRRLFAKGEYTIIRIVSLAIGLAFGIILLGEVLYYYSFDGFYPDANRIYVIQENFNTDNSSEKLESYDRVSGAIAPGIKNEVPGIEAATRLNLLETPVFYTENKEGYDAIFALADEYLFDVLPRPIISGNPKKILKDPMHCMVSDKIAQNIGGNVIGKTIELKNYPDKKLTISGVFKSLPKNTNFTYDILISMSSIGQFMWDGTQNWLGNDRYYSCVKLAKGVKPESLASAVRKMQEKNQDIVNLEKNGEILTYSFKPIKRLFSDQAHDMILILSLIAFTILFVSLMNYVLLTFNSLVNRSKTSAIHKCYGAKTGNLQWLILVETSLVFFIAFIFAVFIIFTMHSWVENQLGHSLSSMLQTQIFIPLLLLILGLIGLISYFPGRFFSKIPVAVAFKNYHQKGNKWKLILLSLQFSGASFILTVLVIVILQYHKIQTADYGYQSENVFYASTIGMEAHKIATVFQELKALPEVEKAAFGSSVPIEGASGNNVLSPDGEKELFNVADFYYIDENYLSILNIPISNGAAFSPETTAINDVLISQKGADLLILNNGWKDGVIEKSIEITEHNGKGASTIKGVFPNFIIGSITTPDTRPAVFFYIPKENFETILEKNPSLSFIIIMKIKSGKTVGIEQKITHILNLALPYKDAIVKNLTTEQEHIYKPERGFRNAMTVGSVIILLIAFIGLWGYTASEINRRRKDLAIRKINGASPSDVIKMFLWDLLRIAIPSVIFGLIFAWFLSHKWMENFAVKLTLHWSLFMFSSLFILFNITIIALISYRKIAQKNPIEDLRYE